MSKIPFEPGEKVFLYLRDSGGEEQDLSTDQQESAARKWALENDVNVTKVYRDEARKGSRVIGREALQQMMSAFRHGCDERGVVVWRYNRFARSVDNAQFYRAEIRSRGYVFYSLNDKVPEGPMGRLFEAAIDFKDEQFLIDLSEDVKRGLYDLIDRYQCVPGPAPRGVMRVPYQIGVRRDGTRHIAHRWEPDPNYAKRILTAFEMRAAGSSLGQIHKETKIMGAINSYRTFFSNTIYKGTLTFGERVYENFIDAMVPVELWDAVQAVQNKYTNHRQLQSGGTDHPRRANSRFLLSGLACCGRCGSPLYGNGHKQPSGRYYDSYVCTRAYRRRDCTKGRIPREKFEAAIVRELHEVILDPRTLMATYQELRDGQADRLAEQDAKHKSLKRDLGLIRKKIRNITDAISELGKKKSKSLTARLLELESEETDIQLKLDMLEATAEAPVEQIPPEILQDMAGEFQVRYDAADGNERRLLLRSLIEHIDVIREENMLRGIIYYYYPDNVSTDRNALGPPRQRHIIEMPFEAKIPF